MESEALGPEILHRASDRARDIFLSLIPPGSIQLDPMAIAAIVSIIIEVVVALVKNCPKPAQVKQACTTGGPLVRFRVRQILRRSGDIRNPYKDQIVESVLKLGSTSQETEVTEFHTYAMTQE